MNSYVQKCIFLIFVFAAGIATTSQNVLAAIYATEGEAAAACYATGNAMTAWLEPEGNWVRCFHNAGSQNYSCTIQNAGWTLQTNCSPEYLFEYTGLCIDKPDIAGSVSGVSPDASPLSETQACKDHCSYNASVPSPSVCSYADTDGNGALSVGESYSCPRDYTPTGSSCNIGSSGYPSAVPSDEGLSDYSDDVAGVPTYDCTNTDCSTPGEGTDPPPTDGGGASPGDPTDSGGTDSSNSGGNSGGGDGDPDTAGTGDGTGTGDTDGDGDRDVDCNPLSNPDCAFAGSGSASSVCGVLPSCSGDPVQCAQLYQSYNVMCAILTAAENEKIEKESQSAQASNNCDTPPVCEGDPVMCTVLRQSWENTCGLVDIDSETPLSDDPDFDRDLAGEGEGSEVDISSGLDDAGFGTGSCPAPIAISTNWANFTIDTAPLCSIAGWVRVFVILFTLLWAGPYVVRSF